MEIWLDTCNVHTIETAGRFGFIHGITTNPSLLAAAHNDYQYVISELLSLQEGPVAVQTTAADASGMIQQAMALHALSDRIVVKIPVVQQGLIAMKTLSQEGVPLMGTAIFQPLQALLAALAGADYVAPYIGRMLDAGNDAYTSLQMMLNTYRNYGFPTKILGAAVRTTDQIATFASMGLHSLTLKDALFFELIADDSNALECLKIFHDDWKTRELRKEAAEHLL